MNIMTESKGCSDTRRLIETRINFYSRLSPSERKNTFGLVFVTTTNIDMMQTFFLHDNQYEGKYVGNLLRGLFELSGVYSRKGQSHAEQGYFRHLCNSRTIRPRAVFYRLNSRARQFQAI